MFQFIWSTRYTSHPKTINEEKVGSLALQVFKTSKQTDRAEDGQGFRPYGSQYDEETKFTTPKHSGTKQRVCDCDHLFRLKSSLICIKQSRHRFLFYPFIALKFLILINNLQQNTSKQRNTVCIKFEISGSSRDERYILNFSS